MAQYFEGEVLRDPQGREVVRFTTQSGVQAIVDTSVPQEALEKFVRKLERKAARRQDRLQSEPPG